MSLETVLHELLLKTQDNKLQPGHFINPKASGVETEILDHLFSLQYIFLHIQCFINNINQSLVVHNTNWKPDCTGHQAVACSTNHSCKTIPPPK
jgi:hypothetical protein